jgi:hypothetical protein
MAFSDFSFPQVQEDLGLALDEADLFSPVPALPLREDFVANVTDGATVALAVKTTHLLTSSPYLTMITSFSDGGIVHGLVLSLFTHRECDEAGRKS